ncbi:MAG: hypothetical protein C0506_10600 [Anaerolinea sp.]|nr:hypothetical protein [Anaerolinea sp.]
MKSIKKSGLGIGLTALTALFGAFVAGGGSALADDTVPTGATVTGTGVAPTIECKWELPDVDDNAANGMQYGNDDNPAVNPGFPCARPTPGSKPTMANGVTNMIEVLPNAHDLPTEKMVELWAAVDHPFGISNISDVYWKIYHPDGSFKVQVHGVREACVGPTGMFAAANATGQITNDAINDTNNGIVSLCQQGVKAIYSASFLISKHQPSGAYKVELHAVSSGNETVLTNYIDVIPFYNLVTDFSSVDFGTIVPGLTGVVAGDLDMTTPLRPTIQNTGNSGMGIGVLFTKMIQQGVAGPKEIDQFDAKFGRTPSTLETLDPIPAGVRADFDGLPARVLCPNRIGKIDFSVHPPSTLPAGVYAGTVTIIARSVPTCLTDRGSVSPITVEDPT